jgi:plasmid stabilization system protein ParE
VKRKRVIRTKEFDQDLDAIEQYIAKDSPMAALDMWLLIDDQSQRLADPDFPRRRGRLTGTKELVVHENYVVVLKEDANTVTLLNIVHARQKWPR